MKLLTAFALGAGLCGIAVLAEAQVNAVTGAGSRTCEQLQADVAELPNTRRAYVSWMQGYLSGRNAAREAVQLGLVDLADYDAQWDWVVVWCGGHPASTFAQAAGALFAERVAALNDE